MILTARSFRLLALAAIVPCVAAAADLYTTTFVPEPVPPPAADARPAPPAFRGHVTVRRPPASAVKGSQAPKAVSAVPLLVDGYVQDGWSSAMAVNPADATN